MIQCDVASISNTKSYLRCITVGLLCSVQVMKYRWAKSSSAPIRHFFVKNIPHTVVSHAFANKNRHVHASAQAHGRPFLTFCVNTVNIRNVFYYGHWICPIQQQNIFEICVVCMNKEFLLKLSLYFTKQFHSQCTVCMSTQNCSVYNSDRVHTLEVE
jgi:hypothetical protein